MVRMCRTICLIAICLVQVSKTVCADAALDYARPMPKVGVSELKGEYLPMDQGFIDENNQVVKLGDFFQAGRPVILAMNYSKCPLLCGTQLSGLVHSTESMKWHAGDEFVVVSVSLDPTESWTQSKETKQRYMQMDPHATSPDAWNFLTGKSTGIKRLANSLGIQYEYVKERQEYAHPAVLVVCTPDGYISRYVYGVAFDGIQLQEWLETAAQGGLAKDTDSDSAMDFVMSCFYFDEKAGVYTAQAWIVLRVGAGLFILAIAGLTYLCHRLVQSKKQQLELSAFSRDSLGHPAR